MPIDKNIVLERGVKKSIVIDAFYSLQLNNQPVVIFCHGYKGFKDWGAWNLMAQKFMESGFCFIKFNFSHNGGTIENPIDFPNLEAFGQNNYSKELQDLNDVIDWVEDHFKDNPFINVNRMSLIGHSRGGGICVIKASEDSRITKLITLASVSDFAKRMSTTGDLIEWKKRGVNYVLNGRTKQKMPHFYQFYEDFKANEERLHIKSSQKEIKIPQLIIHGDADTSVALAEAYALSEWKPDATLEIISGADHVFNTSHPWKKDHLSQALEMTVEKMIDFLKNEGV